MSLGASGGGTEFWKLLFPSGQITYQGEEFV